MTRKAYIALARTGMAVEIISSLNQLTTNHNLANSIAYTTVYAITSYESICARQKSEFLSEKTAKKSVGFLRHIFGKNNQKEVKVMARFLMVSNCEHCKYCYMDSDEPSCYHRYAYWSREEDEAIADNPDNAHYTGISEEQARKKMSTNPRLKLWVEKADRY